MDTDLMTLFLDNQLKQLAAGQVLLIQQARLIAHLTGQSQMVMIEEADELYRQELNKLQLAWLAESRNLKGGPQIDACGGGLEGAG